MASYFPLNYGFAPQLGRNYPAVVVPFIQRWISQPAKPIQVHLAGDTPKTVRPLTWGGGRDLKTSEVDVTSETGETEWREIGELWDSRVLE